MLIAGTGSTWLVWNMSNREILKEQLDERAIARRQVHVPGVPITEGNVRGFGRWKIYTLENGLECLKQEAPMTSMGLSVSCNWEKWNAEQAEKEKR